MDQAGVASQQDQRLRPRRSGDAELQAKGVRHAGMHNAPRVLCTLPIFFSTSHEYQYECVNMVPFSIALLSAMLRVDTRRHEVPPNISEGNTTLSFSQCSFCVRSVAGLSDPCTAVRLPCSWRFLCFSVHHVANLGREVTLPKTKTNLVLAALFASLNSPSRSP